MSLVHLENVKLLRKELGMELVADLPYKSDITDAQLDGMVDRLAGTALHLVFNHGGIDRDEKLIRKARTSPSCPPFWLQPERASALAPH